jgi:tRNA(Ile)-lysidine synthase TilS/MesJ
MNQVDIFEKSLTTTFRASLFSKFLKGINEYQLIQENDKIGVCISGGKDSLILAKLFQIYQKYSKVSFSLEYIVMNPGYNKENLQLIQDNLNLLGIPAKIYDTDIFQIANQQIKSPCFLCAKMRRGALYHIASSLGCNKIALGHHYDDVIETTLMNMLNSGSFQTMLPKLHATNFPNMELIRPLYFVREKDIIAFRDYHQLHFLLCGCKLTQDQNKENKLSQQRLQTKLLIKELEAKHPGIEKNIFSSASNVIVDKILGYKLNNQEYTFLDNYDKK